MFFHQPFVIPSLAFIALAIPLIAGWIPRNRLYGFRTEKTLSNDEIWYRANRVGGMTLVITSLLYLIVAVVAPLENSAGAERALWWFHLIMFVGPLFIGIALTLNFVRRLHY